MKHHIEMIKRQVTANFTNLETALKTYDRDALICNAPAWRYAYHTIHSADKWFFNPNIFTEPDFHQAGMDNPDDPCTITLSDEQLLAYLCQVKEKTLDYLEGLTDEALYEKPEGCDKTRLELILAQFRHISFHTGLLNGNTIERTGKFPVYISPDTYDRLEKGLYDE